MANHILLRKIKLTETTSSITFSNIPQTGYTDLKIVVSGRISASAEQGVLICQPNSATTNLSSTILYGFGNNQGSSSYSVAQSIWSYINGATSTSNGFSSNEIYISNFNSTSAYKTLSVDGLNVNNATNARQSLTAGLWSSNTAISSVKLYPADGSFSASSFLSGSTFSLYGIAATGTSPATAPKADGGNIISTDGTYWYHTFLSSGFFTPISSLTCDYLVVAGGGGGGCGLGYGSGGGGGAGGFRTGTSFSVSSQNYIVQVGAGGASGGTNTAAPGVSGTNSQFSTISSTGGGGGGPVMTGANVANGLPGGSGGGSATPSGIGGAGNLGSYSPVEGYAGGSVAGVASHGAGGGGSSQAGQSETSTVGGAGGNGTSNSYSGSSVTYAGGGGGGASGTGTSGGSGGSGGGGRGANGATDNAVSGTANLGGGGGGARVGTAGSGGSGIVIIRYAV